MIVERRSNTTHFKKTLLYFIPSKLLYVELTFISIELH